MQRQRPVTEAGRTHAEWQQAVIGHGRRPGPEWRLCEGLRPLSSGESAQLAPPTASSSPGLTVSTHQRRSLSSTYRSRAAGRIRVAGPKTHSSVRRLGACAVKSALPRACRAVGYGPLRVSHPACHGWAGEEIQNAGAGALFTCALGPLPQENAIAGVQRPASNGLGSQ